MLAAAGVGEGTQVRVVTTATRPMLGLVPGTVASIVLEPLLPGPARDLARCLVADRSADLVPLLRAARGNPLALRLLAGLVNQHRPIPALHAGGDPRGAARAALAEATTAELDLLAVAPTRQPRVKAEAEVGPVALEWLAEQGLCDVDARWVWVSRTVSAAARQS